MPIETLLSGADAYTTPAEVMTVPQIDTPEATPVISAAVISAGGGALSAWLGC
ncbi:LxmA leader domain family RiPP [Microbispora sp. CA-135349]|uniref:LxmA leader domain family RiPP n=1 Tax=Microbispora sp. CA-135349 TaxID=3239953 RepID=UPI003D950232